LKQAEPLETRAKSLNHWHPNSDQQVLDLVHPSNYCLVFGRTGYSTTPDAILPEHIFRMDPKDSRRGISIKYQWLPAVVHVNDEGAAEFKSYINNLDKKQHPEIYSTIGQIFERMLPLFEKSMGSLTVEPKRRIDASFSNMDFQEERYEYMHKQFETYFEELKASGALDERLAEMDENELDDEMRDEYFDEHGNDDRPINYPCFTDSETADPAKDFITPIPPLNLRNRNLQVIVKLADIHLTPDQPKYHGGSWHVEGMENEAIAATGIYYYDMHNITTSVLRFRHEFDPYIFDYPQSDFDGLQTVYGFHNESLALQEIGGVKAIEGRCVVFPNFLHHRVTYLHVFIVQVKEKTHTGFFLVCY
jgi:hypothetical protein